MNLNTILPLIFVATADAFWRMPCRARTGLARIDPLVNPGTVAEHAHAIHGGRNFGFSTTYSDLMSSNCTSCAVVQDKSAYWTPSLHFLYPNNTAVVVPQIGGMLAYYLLFGENIRAYPEGFRMLSGDSRMRNFTWPVPDPPKSLWSLADLSEPALRQKAIGFNCLNYHRAPEGALYRHFMPTKDYIDENCSEGLRLELMFPSCWNGKDIDSPNHKDHVCHSSLVMDGTCPAGFETRLPSLMYETIWATNAFKGQAGQFVLSNGDPTGFGYHGDFMAGWDVNFLQQAIDQCGYLGDPSGEVELCPIFQLQSDSEAAQCLMDTPSILEQDNCAGPREGLCGGVPIQSGPAYAEKLHAGNAQPMPAPPPPTKADPLPASAASVLPTSLGYKAGTPAVTDNYGHVLTIAGEHNAMPTPKPEPLPQDADKVIGTSIFTSGRALYEIVIEEEIITKTVTATQLRLKRSMHVHHPRGRRAGLRGWF